MTTTADRYTSTTVAPEEAPADRPRWVTPALLSLLVATAVLYLWGLGSSLGFPVGMSAAAFRKTVLWLLVLAGAVMLAAALRSMR